MAAECAELLWTGAQAEPEEEAEASIALLRAVADVAQQRGIRPETLLGSESHVLFQEPAERPYPLRAFLAVLERATELTRDPAFSLGCALQATESCFGISTPVVAHAPTLRRAIALIIRFQPLLVGGHRLRLSEKLGTARLTVEFARSVGLELSFAELLVAGLVRNLHSFGCGRKDIRRVSFAYASPAHAHAYVAAFGEATRFGQPFTGIEFAADALDRTNLHRHAEVHALALASAERTLMQRWQPITLKDQVLTLIHNWGTQHPPDIDAAAAELKISVRTLRRHLGAEGTTYRDLLASIRCDSACSMLRDPALSLQTIAHCLGFSTTPAFYQAFRRWLNMTPGEYRRLMTTRTKSTA